MKTLRVTLSDIVGGTGGSGSTAVVRARYVTANGRGRDVHLNDGTIVVPVRRSVTPGTGPERFDFEVIPSDDGDVREADRGFLTEVSWTVTAPEGGKAHGVRRVLVPSTADAVVQLGLLSTPIAMPTVSATVIDGGNASAAGYVIRPRRDTTLGWAATNPVLALGEIGFDTDTGEVRVGNGVDQWSDLPDGMVNAYSIAVANGFAGDEAAWLASLIGPAGAQGTPGLDGSLYAIGSVSGTLILDPDDGGTQTLTLTANATIIPPSATAGTTITLAVTQGAGAPWTVTWSPRIAWQATPVLSLTAGLTDVVTLVNIDGWGWYGFVSGAGITTAPRAIVDSFARANAASLGTTETGEPWTSTDWTVSSGTALPAVGAATTLAFVDTGAADAIKVSMKVTHASQTVRPYVRASVSGSSYYRLNYSALAATTCQIQRNTGSGFANVGSLFAFGGVVGDRLGLSVTVTAGVATLKAWRNDTEIYSVTDATLPPAETYAGMMGLTAHAVDDFRVDYL